MAVPSRAAPSSTAIAQVIVRAQLAAAGGSQAEPDPELRQQLAEIQQVYRLLAARPERLAQSTETLQLVAKVRLLADRYLATERKLARGGSLTPPQ